MINAKQAVRGAIEHVRSLYEAEIANVMLEEVEYDEDQKQWNVTIGFDRLKPEPPPLARIQITLPTYERVYKSVSVDAESGEALNMRMR